MHFNASGVRLFMNLLKDLPCVCVCDLNMRGCETGDIDWILYKRLAHQRGWCLSDGSLEEQRHLEVWKTGIILAERVSGSTAFRVVQSDTL